MAEYLAGYETAFQQLAELNRRLGLDEESGFQGSLRAAVHALEKQLETIQNPALRISMLTMRRHEKDFMLRRDVKYKDRLNKEADAFTAQFSALPVSVDISKAVLASLAAYRQNFTGYADTIFLEDAGRTEVKTQFAAVEPIFEKIQSLVSAHRDSIEISTRSTTDWLRNLVVGVAGATFLIVAGFAVLTGLSIARPLERLSGAMQKLARGEFDVEITDTSRRDEVGLMARSVDIFKQNGRDATRLRGEQASRQAADAIVSKERIAMAEMIGAGLNKLAAKDLTYRVSNMPEAYHKLQEDFNSALDQLEEAIQAVAGNTDTINTGTQEISTASDDMSKRTETQAANIEETAAAVAEITATVQQTAAGAMKAREVVAGATEEASRSSEVVRQAINAMSDIEKSSQQINQIIGVIDEIAFQTNLLALNAGVEAARAGDVGRGFAVVASEVRALAQRSAEAAKEIKALLQTSRGQVEQGVKLVAETGASLDRIVERVAQVNTVVSEIATNAQSQAAGLKEVNTAVGQMDQTTQQNAAMAEQSTAATRTLANQSQELAAVVAAFTTRALRAVLPKLQEEPARKLSQYPRL